MKCNQLHIRLYLFSLGSPFHPPLPSPSGHHRALSWAFCAMQQIPTVYFRHESEVKSLSRVWLFATPWTAAHQALPSVGFSRQEYWSGLPFPSPDFRLGSAYMLKALFSFDYLCKDPIFKNDHILRYWGLGLQHIIEGWEYNSTHISLVSYQIF